MSHRIKLFPPVFLILIIAVAIAAQTPNPSPPATQFRPTDPLPVDPNVRTGKLPNGLTYYIRRNSEPAKRAELRLAVNAGSVLEDDDQRGLAHFLEHMLFNGTRRFKGPELINFLERTGMEFGPDVNAYTSFDETVYMLKIPTDKPEIIKTSFEVLEDWAAYATLDTKEIDEERGIIVEEWRLRDKNVGGRIRDKALPVLLGGSRYTSRLPIGDMEVVRNAPPEAFRRFYQKWYRPDLMAVVAVGDFDVNQIEALIREHFATLPKPENPAPRPTLTVPDHQETRYLVISDPEMPVTSLQISWKREAREDKTVADYRESLTRNLFNDMLNSRLAEIARKPDAPFIFAAASPSQLVRAAELNTIQAQVKEGKALDALDVIMTEVERARRHGFTETELKRSKDALLRFYEQAFKERETTNSASYAREYVSNFLTGEPIPGIAVEYALAQQLLAAITRNEVNQKASELVAVKNRSALVIAPEKKDLKLPAETELAAALAAVQKKAIQPYVDALAGAALMEKKPATAGIVSERTIPEVGVTEIKLANGVRVLMKPTDFRKDQILFTATSPGGSSLVTDSDYPEAAVIPFVVTQSGVGKFDETSLTKLLYGKTAQVAPRISELSEGFGGSVAPGDLETLFQLIHLYVTAPRADRAAFEVAKNQAREALANRSVSPQAALQDAVIEARYGKTIRRGPLPLAEIEALDPNRAFAIYKERFADLGDFTFTFVGSFNVDEMKRLAQTYLGTLPATRRQETWRDVAPDPPQQVVEKTVRKGKEEQSIVQLIFSGPIEVNPANQLRFKLLDRVLSIRIREELREKRGGIYSPSVGGAVQKLPDSTYSMTVGFSCDPARVNELVEAVFAEIRDLQKNGPTAEDVAKVKEQERRGYEEQLRQNHFWLSAIEYAATTPGEDLLNITRYDARLAALTGKDIQQAAQEYLRTDRYIKVVLYPEAYKEASRQ